MNSSLKDYYFLRTNCLLFCEKIAVMPNFTRKKGGHKNRPAEKVMKQTITTQKLPHVIIDSALWYRFQSLFFYFSL